LAKKVLVVMLVTSKQLGTVLAFLLASALSLSKLAQAQNDHLIVPWERIGPLELGMTAKDLFHILGEPTQISRGPANGISVYNWKGDVSVYVKADGSYVTQICALDPVYATAAGVHPGLPDAAVAELLGPPKNARVFRGWWKLSYTDLFWPGLTVRIPLSGFEANNMVRAVCVNHSDAIPQ
jgi:hypothetical protein